MRGHTGPYVPRDDDEGLDALIASANAVLLTGPPLAGKSRSAYEALRRIEPDDLLVAPRDPGSLLGLIEAEESFFDSIRKPAVLWLDDLQDYVNAGLTAHLLTPLVRTEPRLSLLATIRADQLGTLLSAPGQPGHAMRELRDFFELVELPARASEGEKRRFADLYPGRRMTGGIGETLTAARALMDRLRFGAPPAGTAVVQAALDWRRAGMRRAVPERVLGALFPAYVLELHPRAAATKREFRDGLEWALTPLEAAASLLLPSLEPGARSYDVLDYLALQADAGDAELRRAIPESTWVLVTAEASADELPAVGASALNRRDLDAAEVALRKATGAASSQSARAAAWAGLASVCAEKGEYEAAEEALTKALGDAPEHYRALALGDLLERAGRHDDAREHYRQAAEAVPGGVAEARANDRFLLALALKKQGETAKASEAFSEAARLAREEFEHGVEGAGVMAAMALREGGDEDGANETLELVIRRSSFPTAATAATTLATTLAARGDRARAQQLLEEVVVRGEQFVKEAVTASERANAAVMLGLLQRQLGREEEALEWFRTATEANPDLAAAVNQMLATPAPVLPGEP